MNEIICDKDKKEKYLSSCQKAHSAERAKYMKSMLMLKQQEYSLERNLANLMDNMKLDPEVLRPVLYNMSDISKNRQIFLDGIIRSLEEIAEELRLVKSIKDSPEMIQRLDTNVYKRRLVKFSQKIRKIEESCQLHALSQEQTILQSELREFQMNLHKYESVVGSTGKSLSIASSTKVNKRCQDYKEIQDFHALIAKTGHTENWSDEDHLLFVKLRKKCSNILAQVAAIQAKCPDLTAEIIVNHEAWYKIYLNLREKQRLAVKEWRKQREIEKLKNQEDKTDVEDLIHTPTKKVSSITTKKLPTRLIYNKCEKKILKTDDTVNTANQKKELIKRWRTEREKKRLMDEEQSKNLMAAKFAAQEKRKEKFKRIQESLAEYRERKSIKISLETAEAAASRYDAKLIKAFREQDEEYMNRRKTLIAKLLKPTKTRTVKVVGSQIARKRNYSTFLNSTKVWREKCKTQDLNIKEPKRLQYIKDVPRLWRNKESTEIKDVLIFS